MARVKYVQVEVTKNKMAKVTTWVPQWEAHVIAALWGDDAEILNEETRERDLPEAGDEFQRLADKYGPRDEEVPVVAKVYGSFGPGLRSLEQEFEASSITPEPGAGELLPGSEKTFGEDATPELTNGDKPVKDDVPFYAGNTVDIDGEKKPIDEVIAEGGLSQIRKTAQPPLVAEADFADLTGSDPDAA